MGKPVRRFFCVQRVSRNTTPPKGIIILFQVDGFHRPLVRQERLDDFIRHFYKGVLGAERVILFENENALSDCFTNHDKKT